MNALKKRLYSTIAQLLGWTELYYPEGWGYPIGVPPRYHDQREMVDRWGIKAKVRLLPKLWRAR